MTINKLYKIIKDRKSKLPDKSYTASLFKQGQDRIIQKVGEEVIEVIIAAKNNKKDRIISEMADLWFHILAMLVSLDISPDKVLKELESRRK